jgi:Flp pilus assembly protein TadB
LLGGLLVAFIAVVSALSALLAWAHVRRVSTLTSVDAGSLARSLLRLPQEKRAPELLRRSVAGSWEHSLATEIAAAAGDQARIAAVNEAVARIEQRLDEGAGWPLDAVRIAALSTLLLAVVALLIPRREVIVPILAVGLAGALAALAAKRRARREAKAQREAIDALVAAVAGTSSAAAHPSARFRSRLRGRAGA